ncbi:glycosyl hydrolase family 95 catalytic domain-containing protein [Microbacterium amylolyticum]
MWNAQLPGPWSSAYTTNINMEMAYWPAETTSLPECHEPLLDFVARVATKTGPAAARALYDADGWVLHHNSDIWGYAAPVGAGHGDPAWACWPMGGVWLSLHMWDRFTFDQDLRALRDEAWPVLEATARFALSWVQTDGETAWTAPSTSPENHYLDESGQQLAITMTATMDAELLRALSDACTRAAQALGRDDAWVTELRAHVDLLPPVRIAADGSIEEWAEPLTPAEPDHRHLSHLVGLFPLGSMTPSRTPDLARAAATSIVNRGAESTGWALAWRAAMWARLGEGARVHGQLRMLLRPAEDAAGQHRGGVYHNLFSAHPPFQIDGNLGFTAAIAEALVQSHEQEIRLLPALPPSWVTGNITGIRCRGGITVDVAWANARVTRVTVRSASRTATTLSGPGLPAVRCDISPNRAMIIESKETS